MAPNQPIETVFKGLADQAETVVEADLKQGVEAISLEESAPDADACPSNEEKVEAASEEPAEKVEEEEEPEVLLSGAAARKAAAQRVNNKSLSSRGGPSTTKMNPKLAARKAHMASLLAKTPEDPDAEVGTCEGDGGKKEPVKPTFEELKRNDATKKVAAFRMQEEFGSRVRIKP